MKVSIVTIAYNLPEATTRLFNSAMFDAEQHDIDFYLFLHSFHAETEAACERLAKQYPTTYFVEPGRVRNRGLSRSWSQGMFAAYNAGADVVIIANDDIRFTPGDVDKIARKAVTCRENYMISVAGLHGRNDDKWQPSHGYSCFAINPVALEKVGCFDTNLWPIYLEDCDHHRRATLLGLVEENCRDTLVHHGGSSAINHDPLLLLQNTKTQRLNGEYYTRKHGGINEREIYKHPFNDPDLSWYIPFERLNNPYGFPYDREDRDMEII